MEGTLILVIGMFIFLIGLATGIGPVTFLGGLTMLAGGITSWTSTP